MFRRAPSDPFHPKRRFQVNVALKQHEFERLAALAHERGTTLAQLVASELRKRVLAVDNSTVLDSGPLPCSALERSP